VTNQPGKNVDFIDRYQDARPAGKVIGSWNDDTQRKGIDLEGQIGIDHGALRIQPLFKPGWGRAGIAYGPFTRQNGLGLGIHILNGHQASHTSDLSESRLSRLKNWLKGSETETKTRRLLNWLRAGNKSRTLRHFLSWHRIQQASRKGTLPTIDVNLALGWFSDEVPLNPTQSQQAFYIRSLASENGELLAQVGNQGLVCLPGLQNIPLYLILILRQNGAAYYAASISGVSGLPAYPQMKPLAIEPIGSQSQVFAGVHQSVLGQIGFRADTRLYSLQVKDLPAYSAWYGTAHTADRLAGHGDLQASPCEVGGSWQVVQGTFQRTPDGLQALESENIALVETSQPVGLLHLILEGGLTSGEQVGLIWRSGGPDEQVSVALSRDEILFTSQALGVQEQVKQPLDTARWDGSSNAIQIRDDGRVVACFLNGRLVLETPDEGNFPQGSQIGLYFRQNGGACKLHSFEAHPQSLPIPAAFEFEPPLSLDGEQTAVWDDFNHRSGQTLEAHQPASGGSAWHKQFGAGTIELLEGSGAVVRANAHNPNPGRTIYTLPWHNAGFADLQTTILAPGSARGQGEKGRAGLVFWQDPRNYILINTWLDDYAAGASISSFFHLHGFEEIYDAIWTNVGTRIAWGQAYTLRVVFDGVHYYAYVDGEAVLYRALTDVYPDFKPLRIQQIGIVANWEWGNDTGSRFLQFEAKDRRGS
jgi:hypothetical protein